jgi:hypothetical protein
MSLKVSWIEEIGEDADGDGIVALELEQPVPEQSVWVAVDLATSSIGLATPAGYPLRAVELGPQAFRSGLGGAVHLLEQDKRYLKLLLVRREVGAYRATVGDGGTADFDGRGNGRLTFPLDLFEPAGAADILHPPTLRAGDVLVAIDIDSLETAIARAPGAPQNP